MSAPMFPRLALIGIGLIGGSIALAARRAGRGRAHRDLQPDAGDACARRSSSGSATAITPTRRMRRATPIASSFRSRSAPVGAVTAAIAGALKPGAIVSDVGSVKASVVAAMQPHIPKGVHFVPAHPVAGTEYSGPDAGFVGALRQSLVHPDAAGGDRSGGGRNACRRSGARSAPMSRR